MKIFVPALAAFALGAAASPLAAAPTQMQEGLWEITTVTEIVGAPTQGQPVTTQACYSRQDVESENAAAPKDDKCEILDYRVAGNVAAWAIRCAGKENITGDGSLTFHSRQAYSGTARLRMQPEGQAEIRMNNRYSGKRIGDCSQ